MAKIEDSRSTSMKKSQKKVASHIYNTLNNRSGTAEGQEEHADKIKQSSSEGGVQKHRRLH